MPGYRRS
ncbi:hypothetical protein E2C01_051774 [Portunus trituberculatus]|nr:hypothetical protein [Portunus trituberculatus]